MSTARGIDVLAEARVELDALVASGTDAGERYGAATSIRSRAWSCAPRVRPAGLGARASGESGRWSAAPLPGPISDAYGCGDSFAGGLTHGLGAGMDVDDALALGARCGAACFTGRGPTSASSRRRRPEASQCSATVPPSGSRGRPFSAHATRPPAMLRASNPLAVKACVASAERAPTRQ